MLNLRKISHAELNQAELNNGDLNHPKLTKVTMNYMTEDELRNIYFSYLNRRKK